MKKILGRRKLSVILTAVFVFLLSLSFGESTFAEPAATDVAGTEIKKTKRPALYRDLLTKRLTLKAFYNRTRGALTLTDDEDIKDVDREKDAKDISLRYAISPSVWYDLIWHKDREKNILNAITLYGQIGWGNTLTEDIGLRDSTTTGEEGLKWILGASIVLCFDALIEGDFTGECSSYK